MSNIIPFQNPSIEISDEIERALLGILLSHPERLNDVVDIISPEMFLTLPNKQIYEIVRQNFLSGHPLNFLTITPNLSNQYFETENQKRQYLSQLVSSFVTDLNAREYAHQIKRAYDKRRIKDILDSPLGEMEKASAISELQREISKPESHDIVPLSMAMERALDKIDTNYKRGGGFQGLLTGLVDLDNTICGLEDGGLYILAGRPAMGKTALGLTIAINVARKQNPVLFFSLEMSNEQLVHRLNARFAETSIWAQKNGPRDLNFAKLISAKDSMRDIPLSIVDRGGLNIEQISSIAYEFSKQIKPRLIVIDHLGIVSPRDFKLLRVHQISEMTARLKTLAKEIGLPILLLHQLNRGVEGRDDKRPGLSDLRDSGSVEQDADVVMLLYRQEYYLRNAEPQEPSEHEKWLEKIEKCQNLAQIIIAKNRQGEALSVNLRFDGQRQVFENFGA